jgi:uncharacterized cupin superfamily protein
VRRFNLLFAELEPEEEQFLRPGFSTRSTRVGEVLGAALIGGTVYDLAEGERICPYHYHHGQEEWLYVVSGNPTLRSPSGERALRAGDVACFPRGPDGAHGLTGPGRVLLLSAQHWPEVVVYPDSDKLGARPGPYPQHLPDRGNFRRSDAVDYWDGE